MGYGSEYELENCDEFTGSDLDTSKQIHCQCWSLYGGVMVRSKTKRYTRGYKKHQYYLECSRGCGYTMDM